ncbi:flagellar hook-basal body complex protein FliE [Rhizobiales bacterium GAS113]|jgi:flagellar hook-basal body complex protein FliE|nr:flagellar hook-basal body complex protein FliE [Rhizobiales bacterium GAS113]
MISAISPIITGIVPASPLESVGPGPAAVSATPGAGTSNFGDMLAQVTHDAVSTLKAGEAAAISGIEGHASVQHVVEAVMSAQTTLQTAVAVRDKVISAYQDISRMAI